MNMAICLAAGSLVGGFARWLLAGAVHGAVGSRFPFGTLAVNLSGCLLIGALHGLGEVRLGAQGRMLLMVGFCGAFTTFSAWMLESSAMLDRGDWKGASAYLVLSVILGFALFRLGAAAGRIVSAPAIQVMNPPETPDKAI